MTYMMNFDRYSYMPLSIDEYTCCAGRYRMMFDWVVWNNQ